MKNLLFVLLALWPAVSIAQADETKYKVMVAILGDNLGVLDSNLIANLPRYDICDILIDSTKCPLYRVLYISTPVLMGPSPCSGKSFHLGAYYLSAADPCGYIFVEFRNGGLYCIQGKGALDIAPFCRALLLEPPNYKLKRADLKKILALIAIPQLDRANFTRCFNFTVGQR
jgi:hypothetical protein